MPDLDIHLAAIVAGDTQAFARWVAGAEPAVRLGLSRFNTQVDVEVIVQEALLRAWQLAPRITADARGNSLLRFTMRAARNLAIDEIRRRRLEAPHLSSEPLDPSPSEPDPLLRKNVRDCQQKLPQKPAQVLAARLEAQGSEPDEVLAERLGMKLNTLLKNFGRARQLLLECLEQRGIVLNLGGPT